MWSLPVPSSPRQYIFGLNYNYHSDLSNKSKKTNKNCKFKKNNNSKSENVPTFHSKPPTAMPPAAAWPAKPMNKLLPTLLDIREAPICKHTKAILMNTKTPPYIQYVVFDSQNLAVVWRWAGGRSLARRLCFGGNLINNHCLCYVQSCIPVIPDYHFTQSLFFRTLQSIQNAAAPPQYTQLWQEHSVALLPQMYHNYQYI